MSQAEPTSVDASRPALAGHAGTHAHLWQLPDGTGLHAPWGRLTRDEDTGQVCCHLCGVWFRALGSHLRRHGLTAAGYRDLMGLCSSRPMTSPELSAAISTRQAAAYRERPEFRARLAAGQELARSGRLSGRGGATARACAEHDAVRRAALEQGRRTRAEQRSGQVTARLAALGRADLADYLRAAYAGGASLTDLAWDTGLSHTRVRMALTEAGVALRAQGQTTGAGRRSRAHTADRRAADRVGTTDLAGWLQERYADGWSLGRLGAAVGHSSHWVRSRLPGEGQDTPAAYERSSAKSSVTSPDANSAS